MSVYTALFGVAIIAGFGSKFFTRTDKMEQMKSNFLLFKNVDLFILRTLVDPFQANSLQQYSSFATVNNFHIVIILSHY